MLPHADACWRICNKRRMKILYHTEKSPIKSNSIFPNARTFSTLSHILYRCFQIRLMHTYCTWESLTRTWQYFMCHPLCWGRVSVAQSVATRAVNAGVVSSNPSMAKILSDIWQKLPWQASFAFHQLANSLCGNAASCLESMLWGGLVWESHETHELVNWSPWYDWKKNRYCLTKNIYCVEDEIHFLVICPLYDNIRKYRFLQKWTRQPPSQQLFIEIMSDISFNAVTTVAKFLIKAFELRDNVQDWVYNTAVI